MLEIQIGPDVCRDPGFLLTVENELRHIRTHLPERSDVIVKLRGGGKSYFSVVFRANTRGCNLAAEGCGSDIVSALKEARTRLLRKLEETH